MNECAFELKQINIETFPSFDTTTNLIVRFWRFKLVKEDLESQSLTHLENKNEPTK